MLLKLLLNSSCTVHKIICMSEINIVGTARECLGYRIAKGFAIRTQRVTSDDVIGSVINVAVALIRILIYIAQQSFAQLGIHVKHIF